MLYGPHIAGQRNLDVYLVKSTPIYTMQLDKNEVPVQMLKLTPLVAHDEHNHHPRRIALRMSFKDEFYK